MDKLLTVGTSNFNINEIMYISVDGQFFSMVFSRNSRDLMFRETFSEKDLHVKFSSWILIKKREGYFLVNPKHISGYEFDDTGERVDKLYLTNGNSLDSINKTGFNKTVKSEIIKHFTRNLEGKIKVTYGY